MSTLDGLWNEQIRTDVAFVTALKHLTAASKLACAAIVARRPDAVIVHSESAEISHEARMLPSALWQSSAFLRRVPKRWIAASPRGSRNDNGGWLAC